MYRLRVAQLALALTLAWGFGQAQTTDKAATAETQASLLERPAVNALPDDE